MLLDAATVSSDRLADVTGWRIEPRGACRGEICVPLRAGTVQGHDVDVAAFAEQVGLALVADPGHRLWALGGPIAAGRALADARAPELVLPDLDGRPFDLADLRGTKVVLVAWASWCSCSYDLPVWAELRERLRPHGVEIVTVAMDAGGPVAAAPHVAAAGARHPTLVDTDNVLATLFGVVNVPSSVWIDERGMIVRPAEPAWPGRSPRVDALRAMDVDAVSGTHRDIVALSKEIDIDPQRHLTMLLDWAEHGADSVYALTPDEVVAYSAPTSSDIAQAAAHWELAQEHHRSGRDDAAAAHRSAAQRLAPDNWTYKRQTWALEDPASALDLWARAVRDRGPENYYRRLPT